MVTATTRIYVKAIVGMAVMMILAAMTTTMLVVTAMEISNEDSLCLGLAAWLATPMAQAVSEHLAGRLVGCRSKKESKGKGRGRSTPNLPTKNLPIKIA